MGAQQHVVDDDFVRRAVSKADPNVLRITLLQITGDQKYAGMKLGTVTGRGGAYSVVSLADECVEEVREDAVRLLRSGAHRVTEKAPADATLQTLLESLMGRPVSARQLRYYKEELAFESTPFSAHWTTGRPAAADRYSVVVIGAGVSGIAMGVQLNRLGIPYVILERRHEIGGTWSINIYPDARVDTTSFIYQYKFEKKYPWSEYYARQSEVRSYLEHVARTHGVYGNIRLNTAVEGGSFDEKSSLWTLNLSGGGSITANFVVSATGLFSNPRPLEVPGVETFSGTRLHTTDWSEDVDLTGKSVAVVGNGSTGVQLLARVAEAADQVYVFQRTPQWITPTESYGDPLEPELRWLLDELPYYWNWFCFSRVVPYFSMADAQKVDPAWRANGGSVSERNDAARQNLTAYIESQLQGRKDLIDRLVPDYPPLARRLIIDNGWYKSLLRPNVKLVTAPIREITERSVVTEDGAQYPVDLLLTATGFTTTKYVWPARYTGLGGVRLEEVWNAAGPRAYLGMCVPGFPNFFMMYGPNAQTRASGLVAFVEQWTRYIAHSIRTVIEQGIGSIDVRPDAFQDYNVAVDAASTDIVWNLVSAERNYYLNEHGRQHVSAPWLAEDSYEMLLEPKLADFFLRG